MLAWFVTYRSRDQRYDSPQARSWSQLLRDVQSPAADWDTTPQGWAMYHPPHPTRESQVATGVASRMDPSMGESSESPVLTNEVPDGYTSSTRGHHDLDYAPPSQDTDEGLDYGEDDE